MPAKQRVNVGTKAVALVVVLADTATSQRFPVNAAGHLQVERIVQVPPIWQGVVRHD